MRPMGAGGEGGEGTGGGGAAAGAAAFSGRGGRRRSRGWERSMDRAVGPAPAPGPGPALAASLAEGLIKSPRPLMKKQAVKRHHHKHNLKHRYEFLETLGKGTYGKVKKARERSGKLVRIFPSPVHPPREPEHPAAVPRPRFSGNREGSALTQPPFPVQRARAEGGGEPGGASYPPPPHGRGLQLLLPT